MVRLQEAMNSLELELLATLPDAAGLLLVCTLVAVLGLIPFLMGAFVQAILPRRVPLPVICLLGVPVFFALRHFGWIASHVHKDIPVWSSVATALVFFYGFFATGATVLRDLRSRRSGSSSGSPDPR